MSAPGTAGRTWLIGGAAVLLTVLGILAVGAPGGDTPLSPTSDERLGTSALVALAGELGADVTTSDRLPELDGPGPRPEVMVLLRDVLGDGQRDAVDAWIDGGGRLIVTDPSSPYAPEVVDDFSETSDLGPRRTLDGDCEIGALDAVEVAGVEPHNGGLLFHPGSAGRTCLSDATGAAFLVATDRGGGTVLAMGGSGLVVNEALAGGENAAVVAAVVAPTPGTRVVVLEPGALAGSGGGGRTLGDLVSPAVKAALAQLGIACVVFALWRARRLGRPVAEPQPVALAGSELVAAVGTLYNRTGAPAHAAEVLRAELRGFLGVRLGVPRDAGDEALAAVAAERIGIDADRVRAALGVGPAARPVTDDAALVALARTIDRIREEVLAHV
ncbi:MAG TPA: DUF4350 domain-containing protein [Acidimicrobiales bacterium]|nr:DUF4350 domain-containing protein [Acidimicrobiales bacterium]